MPAELCTVLPDQPYKGKLSAKHTAEIIKVACNPPEYNARHITTTGLQSLGFDDENISNPLLKNSGISIDNEMTVVPARILPVPRLTYLEQGREGIRASDASWRLMNIKFYKGARLDRWAVLVIKDGPRSGPGYPNDVSVETTVGRFVAECKNLGIHVGSEEPTYLNVTLPRPNRNDPSRSNAIQEIRKTIRGLRQIPELLFVVLPNTSTEIYAGLKRLCDVELDVHTVCVQWNQLRKAQERYFANVALKVNMKLGGVNHILERNTPSSKWLLERPTMIVGMDVTHSSPGSQQYTPSVAAVVASVDDCFAQFPVSLEIQKSRQEEIAYLEKMMVERITAYKAKSGRLPERILVYRDGVSEVNDFSLLTCFLELKSVIY